MRSIVRFLAVVVILVSIVGAVGCSSGSKTVGSAKDRAVSMVKLLPSNVSDFYYRDLYMLRTDKNLSAEWSSLEQQSNNSALLQKIDGLGVDFGDMTELVLGSLSLDQFMAVSSNGSYNYGGFKVSMYTDGISAVRVNGTSIYGYDDKIRSCIDVANGNGTSLYSNEGVKSILDRLPDGYGMQIVVGNESAPAELAAMLVFGFSITKHGSTDVKTNVYKFNSSDAAQEYVQVVSNESQDANVSIDRTQDGAFVREVMTPVTATPTPTPTVALTPEPTATPVVTVTPTP